MNRATLAQIFARTFLLALLGLAVPSWCSAANIAVYADGGANPAVGELITAGHVVTMVTQLDIENGLANAADVFFYTRNAFSFGSYLGPLASAQITATFTGNKVLHFTDMTDLFSDPTLPGYADAQTMLLNSVAFASSGGKGFIGEFNGSGWALQNGMLPGADLGQTGYVYNPQINVQPGHPVMAGIGPVFAYTDGFDFLSMSNGIPAANILAVDTANGFVTTAASVVPEPATVLSLGLAAIGLAMFRRSRGAK